MAKTPKRTAAAKPAATTSISTLTLDPNNARRHPERNTDAIKSSIQETGLARSIVIDEHDTVLAGNATVKSARELGIKKLKIVEADGQTLIAVRRRGLSEAEKIRLALADNRAAELAEWDPEVIKALAASGQAEGFWTALELAAIVGGGHKTGLTDPEQVPDVRPTDIMLGDQFKLGIHRLMCGDSTQADQVAIVMDGTKGRLMNTDPPYGVGLDLTNNHSASNSAKGITKSYRKFKAVANDELEGAKLQVFLEACIRAAVPCLDPNAAFYLWHPMLTQGTFFAAAAAAAAAVLIHRQIIWVKPHFIFGRGDYHWRHELCFYGWRTGHRPPFYGKRNQDTVWSIDEGGGAIRKDQHHPTQKPVELFRRPIAKHVKHGEVIYEPFAGSGSQFIAAEEAGVVCRGMELEPGYCQVVIDRWEAFTGQKAVKL